MNYYKNKICKNKYLCVIFYFVVCLILLFSFIVVANWEAKRQANLRMTSFYTNISNLLQISTTIIINQLKNYDNTLLALRDAYTENPEKFSEYLSVMRKGPLADTEILLVLVDKNGYLKFTDAPNVTPRMYLGDRKYFRYFADGGGKDHLYIDEPVFGRVTQRYTLPIVRPVYDKTGAFNGVIAASVKQQTLGDLKPNLNLSEDITINIINHNGMMVTSSLNLEKVQMKKINDNLLVQFLTKQSGRFWSNDTFTDGEQVIEFQHIEGTPLIIYIEKSPKKVLSAIKTQRNMLIITAGLTAFAIILVFIVYLRGKKKIEKYIETQKNYLKEAFGIANMGSWELNLETNIFQWSDEIFMLLGKNCRNFIPTLSNFLSIIPDEEQNEFKSALNKAVTFGGASFEHSLIRANGEIRQIFERCKLKRNALGKPEFLIGTLQDITEQKQKEKEYQTIIHTALDGFWILDAQGNFIEVNDAYCKMSGYTRSELIKMSVLEIDAVENLEETITHIKKIRETGYDQFESRHRCKNKNIIDVEINAKYIELNGGRFYVFVKNITERKLLQQQLIHSEKLSAVGQLLAGVAHEFNNVLAINMSGAQLLQNTIAEIEIDKEKNNEILQCIESILISNKRGAAIVNNMMMVARISLPKKTLSTIADIIDDVLKLQKQQLELENIEVVKKYSVETKAGYDIGQLQQVFLNLIINARHAIKKNAKGKIIISIEETKTEKIVIFQDSGVGMTKDVKNKIFTPFFTTKGAFSDNNLGINGSGLGLSVTYQIIKNHNGTIRVESEEGYGAKFIITLPIELKAADKSNTNINVQTGVGIENIEKNISVLFVDDENFFLETIEKIFRKLGYKKLFSASTGKEALKIIEKNRIDVVFLDLLMPEMSGEQIYDEITKLNKNIHIIFMSGQIELNGDDLKNNKQAYAYISKPFDVNKIVNLLNEISRKIIIS